MSSLRRVARGSGLVASGLLSITLGLLLAYRIVQPSVINHVGTGLLIGLILLLGLPALTFFAIREDRRALVRLRSMSWRGGARPAEPLVLSQPATRGAVPNAAASRTVRHRPHAAVAARDNASREPLAHASRPGAARAQLSSDA